MPGVHTEQLVAGTLVPADSTAYSPAPATLNYRRRVPMFMRCDGVTTRQKGDGSIVAMWSLQHNGDGEQLCARAEKGCIEQRVDTGMHGPKIPVRHVLV